MDAHVDSGEDPLLMAKAIYEVIQVQKPKVDYRIGAFLQKFSITLKKILPSRMYEKMLLNHYKL